MWNDIVNNPTKTKNKIIRNEIERFNVKLSYCMHLSIKTEYYLELLQFLRFRIINPHVAMNKVF